MFGTELPDLGATGRECPMHCSCDLCHGVIDDYALSRATKCAYSGADGSLLVLQRVSIADDLSWSLCNGSL
jgi:hypothetical protein